MAKAKQVSTPTPVVERKWTVEALVASMKSDIELDIKGGVVPETVGSFSELHDYVDANCYGGLCDDEAPSAIDDEAFCEATNKAQEEVDRWLKARAFARSL